MKFYSKQPIEAEQFDGSLEMMDKYDIEPTTLCMAHKHSYTRIYKNDWIITGVNGEHWKIADNVFQQQYAELPVIPKPLADWIDKCKKDMESLCWAMDEQNLPKKVDDYFRNYYTREQWIEIQDTFARAWIDGYRVEEEK